MAQWTGDRRAAVMVPHHPVSVERKTTLSDFLASPAAHKALLDAPKFSRVEGADGLTFKCNVRARAALCRP